MFWNLTVLIFLSLSNFCTSAYLNTRDTYFYVYLPLSAFMREKISTLLTNWESDSCLKYLAPSHTIAPYDSHILQYYTKYYKCVISFVLSCLNDLEGGDTTRSLKSLCNRQSCQQAVRKGLVRAAVFGHAFSIKARQPNIKQTCSGPAPVPLVTTVGPDNFPPPQQKTVFPTGI